MEVVCVTQAHSNGDVISDCGTQAHSNGGFTSDCEGIVNESLNETDMQKAELKLNKSGHSEKDEFKANNNGENLPVGDRSSKETNNNEFATNHMNLQSNQ